MCNIIVLVYIIILPNIPLCNAVWGVEIHSARVVKFLKYFLKLQRKLEMFKINIKQ